MTTTDWDSYQDPWTEETWRKRFAWLPTRIGIRKDGTMVWTWWKEYWVAGKGVESYSKWRRPLTPIADVKPFCVWEGG